MKWSDSLATGVTMIDEQHKELIERINRLLAACTAGKGKEEIGKTVEFLGEYVTFHFGTEEEYMNKHNYPDYRSHKAQHEKFVKDFAVLKSELEARGPAVDIIARTNSLLVDWLIGHIRGTDKATGAFLKTRV